MNPEINKLLSDPVVATILSWMFCVSMIGLIAWVIEKFGNWQYKRERQKRANEWEKRNARM